jgi:hypothetical protein
MRRKTTYRSASQLLLLSLASCTTLISVAQQGVRTVYTVDMGRSVGFVGGQTGAALGNPTASHIRLVLEGTDVITAFPVIP